MSETKVKHRSKIGTKATLLLCACDCNALGSEMAPILAVIAMAFPGENVNILVSLPPLCVIPASIIAGRLAYYVSRKTILTIGQILFIIGGLGGAFAPTFEALVATRIFFGVGCGLVYPIVPTLISYFFAGEERVKMMGGVTAVGSVIAMIFSTLSGTLALIGWQAPFFVNIFFIFVLIMQLIFLPKVPPEKDLDTHKRAAELSPQERKIGYRAWFAILLLLVTMTIGMVYLLKVAIFVQEAGIGDSVTAGLGNSLQTGTALLASVFFAVIFRHLKRYTILISVAAPAISYAILSVATTQLGFFVGSAFFGLFLGTAIPYLQTAVSGCVHPYRRTFALSLLSTALFAGQALAASYIALMESFVGTSTVALFQVMAIMYGIIFVIVLIYLLATRKNAEYPYSSVTE